MSAPEVGFRQARIAVVGPFPPRPGELSGQTELLCRPLQDEGVWVQRVNTDVPGVRRLPLIGIHLLPMAQVLVAGVCWWPCRAAMSSTCRRPATGGSSCR